MQLIEAILNFNHKGSEYRPADYEEELPLVLLTCIDPRLNVIIPEVIGLPEDKFIWLRNAGNIIFDSMSSMTRTLALGCAIKGGREIAIIGHTDCKVRQTSVLQLTDRFKELGIQRTQLPENLTEFFGLFASERQNVLRGVDFVRKSPLIGPRVAVHGLLVDVETRKLEWIVNGYEALTSPRSAPASAPYTASQPHFAPFQMGEMAFPSNQIGDAVPAPVTPSIHEPVMHNEAPPVHQELPAEEAPPVTKEYILKIDPGAIYKLMDANRRVHGPLKGQDLKRWLEEGRIDVDTLIQRLGYKDWRPLRSILEEVSAIPLPPTIGDALRYGIDKVKAHRKK